MSVLEVRPLGRFTVFNQTYLTLNQEVFMRAREHYRIGKSDSNRNTQLRWTESATVALLLFMYPDVPYSHSRLLRLMPDIFLSLYSRLSLLSSVAFLYLVSKLLKSAILPPTIPLRIHVVSPAPRVFCESVAAVACTADM